MRGSAAGGGDPATVARELATQVDGAHTRESARGRNPHDPSARWVYALCLAGIVFWIVIVIRWLVVTVINRTFIVSDFTGFLVGSSLLGTQQLYDVGANVAKQREWLGITNDGIIYARQPFFAATLTPLLHVPYAWSICAWNALLLSCLVLFVCCFRFVNCRYVATTVAWSLPAALAFAVSNDAPILLLLFTLSLVCFEHSHHTWSGVLLGVCTAKFHFLLLIPLLLVRREYRRVLGGFIGSVCVLFGIDFVVQPNWPSLYWNGLHIPQANMNSHPALMPNIYAALSWTGYPAWAVVAGGLLASLLLWGVCNRLSFQLAMPLCVLGGIVASPHAGAHDTMLAIPALLLVADRFPNLKWLAIMLLSPAAASLYMYGPNYLGPAIFVAACFWLLYKVNVYSRTLTVTTLANPSVSAGE